MAGAEEWAGILSALENKRQWSEVSAQVVRRVIDNLKQGK